MFEYEFIFYFNKYKNIYDNDKNKKYKYIVMKKIKNMNK